jgi:hypothetical protein
VHDFEALYLQSNGSLPSKFLHCNLLYCFPSWHILVLTNWWLIYALGSFFELFKRSVALMLLK